MLVAALLAAVVVGPWLARVAVRLAARDDAARPGRLTAVDDRAARRRCSPARSSSPGRPATAALAWAAGAAVVLGAVDLAGHRLPDRVTYPAFAVCAAALLVDAAVVGVLGGAAAGRRRRGGRVRRRRPAPPRCRRRASASAT